MRYNLIVYNILNNNIIYKYNALGESVYPKQFG